MEHRQGSRFGVGVPVSVSGCRRTMAGYLINISLTGAYVQTRADQPVLARIQVEVELPGPAGTRLRRLAASVVRADVNGYGIEWHNLNPRTLGEILKHFSTPRCHPGIVAAAGPSAAARFG
ncbi:MAG TPA: PilZ domain-containing protein [Steroidobacteraceae bacterium]|nr:PilZ domain-containing protein [Steroidobacteraceae bacterium]